MKQERFINRTILVASLVLFPLMLPGMISAAEPMEVERPFSEGPMKGLEQIAVESVQDTLKACLGRIPLDATAGQLILAEQNCQQVEVERKGTRLTF